MAAEQIHDFYGTPVLGSNPMFFSTSAYSAVDQHTLVLSRELQELQKENRPKADKIPEEKASLKVIRTALHDVHKQIIAAKQEVPQPSWLTTPTEFKAKLDASLSQESGIPQKDLPGSRLDQIMDNYDIRPIVADDVIGKIAEVHSQIQQMNSLVYDIDKQFDYLKTHPKVTNNEFLQLSKQGITSIESIYAIDPGRFEPKDGEGRPTKYEPRNLTHSLQAVLYYLEDPIAARKEGMQLLNSDAIKELPKLIQTQTAENNLSGQNMTASPGSAASPPPTIMRTAMSAPAPSPVLGQQFAPAQMG